MAMTKAQAEAKVSKIVKDGGDRGWGLVEQNLPKVEKAVKSLRDELKTAESPEMVDTLVKGLKLHLKPLGEGIALLTWVLGELKKATDDEELFALMEKDITAALRDVTGKLEKARNAARTAKTALDDADKYLANQDTDADSAGEDWATAVSEFERITGGAAKEAPAWQKWESDALGAAGQRNQAALDKLKKAKPKSAFLDWVAAWPKDMPFFAYDRKYKVGSLPKSLQDEIARDRAKAMPVYTKTRALADAKDAIDKRVQALAVAPRDLKKALTALTPHGFPADAGKKLQPVLDGPTAELAKGLDALAKALKLKTTGKDLYGALRKAGVID